MDDLLLEFDQLEMFHNSILLKATCTNNLRLLRKMSSINKHGYFRDSEFIQNMMRVCSENESWGSIFVDEKISVCDGNVEAVLTLLSNSRLKSPINLEVFDVNGKKKVQ